MDLNAGCSEGLCTTWPKIDFAQVSKTANFNLSSDKVRHELFKQDIQSFHFEANQCHARLVFSPPQHIDKEWLSKDDQMNIVL